ncbi:MAG: hypothetical protein CMK32_16665 [Porticoccaceae bacterium]|nr:hypothetical protein [Porticoccaceae bacterium]
MKRWLLILLLVVFTWRYFDGPPPVPHGQGVTAPESPSQSPVQGSSFAHKDYRVTPLANFALTARVLSRRDYRFDREADLSPTDLALGWGPMSDSAVLNEFSISQRNRWYFWRADNMVIPRREVEQHSANMHMIPANSAVERQLKAIREGDIVTVQGHLVKVEGGDGWRWVSSLSRGDTGDGSCELVWVTSLSVVSG